VNVSPRNTNATKKVKRLDVLLRIVFDCANSEKQDFIIRPASERTKVGV
jgi:hypothetical protein